MNDCIFCKILTGEIPSNKVYEDDLVYAFYDINPAAPKHILIIPKEHICCANKLEEKHAALVGHIILTAQKIAKEQGFAEDGYRIVNNCGENAGQTVFHLHFHLLAGGKFDRMV
ncbi:MAG: histidine triad nucleotide-binding protein [Clostridia bacterium]|nr:histidine triad nucleotide-binding protein [Clostridia bacterium]MBQ3554062.1 histidine triad nucleotide-binding protein [Clostridia bacterium]